MFLKIRQQLIVIMTEKDDVDIENRTVEYKLEKHFLNFLKLLNNLKITR